ncbi:undecaprenyl-diphosphate phosphatase [Poseidonocella sedimentorum]|uniref:Undecaprenyl-diphosphatase n=1 Tax=Poseidonocella sedimentorum TaxID=871652 RepID=A0A1I6EQV6_9RHOB|nr:undecaprenyl-diphosphate phosphatase [Poseidonocella sedimentorum]SFR20176.1 undecaprenyl-diphosphatase [Poseidonocella sedimentorum]
MTLFNLLLVAIVQGITEFLPVSSSGHLILLPNLTGLADQGLAIDVAVHVGTLVAVVLYFRQDVGRAIRGGGHLLRGRTDSPESRLALGLVVATIPVVIAGFVLKITGLSDMLRSVAVVGWATLVFGLLLYVADQRGPQTRDAGDWTLSHALWMGLWQAVALIPGTSRSGITITASRLLGYERQEGARLAMLMSIPTILASGTLLGLDIASEGTFTAVRESAIAAAFACLAALAALSLMMRLLSSVSYTPYVIYRIFLGLALLAYAYL